MVSLNISTSEHLVHSERMVGSSVEHITVNYDITPLVP
eukprot:COSAG01_NODE_1007_length_12161_cov_12.669624_11_plen_38_part_00